jgi:hypothetical protein
MVDETVLVAMIEPGVVGAAIFGHAVLRCSPEIYQYPLANQMINRGASLTPFQIRAHTKDLSVKRQTDAVRFQKGDLGNFTLAAKEIPLRPFAKGGNIFMEMLRSDHNPGVIGPRQRWADNSIIHGRLAS